MDPNMEKLGLDFKSFMGKADDGKIYVVQSTGQILVTMTSDRLLDITGTEP